jgi:pentatricopeptide repeat protein
MRGKNVQSSSSSSSSSRTQRGTMRPLQEAEVGVTDNAHSKPKQKRKIRTSATWKGNNKLRHKSKHQQRTHNRQGSTSSGSQPVYQFNHLLQRILQDNSADGNTRKRRIRRPPTWESVKQAQHLLLTRVRSSSDTNTPSADHRKSSSSNNNNAYDVISFNIVLQAWAKQRSMEAAQAADNLLQILWRETNLRADSYSYAAVLHAYAKANGGRPAALRASELLKRYIQLSIILNATTNVTTSNSNMPKQRTDICHNAAMDAWAVSGDDMAGHRAEQILRQLRQDPLRSATRVSFNSVIKAYARCGQPEEAQRILDEMKQLAIQTKDPSVAPDKVSLSTCIHAWAKSTNDLHRAAACADALLCEMEQAYNATGDERLRPDVVAYSSVLAAIAKSPTDGSSSKALDLLRRMNHFGKEKPNAAFLNTWIHLLSKSNQTSTAVSSAEAILEYMKDEFTKGKWNLQPCKVTYTAVISVLARGLCTAATADRAEELLNELTSLWNATGDQQYLPNAKTFASVLNTLSKCGLEDGIERAEKIHLQMQGLYNATKSEELRPNVIVYMQMFQILARRRGPDAGRKAKEILQEMNRLFLMGFDEVRPDATTMAYFLNTLTKSNVENTVEIATLVVNEVEEGYNAGIGHLKPTSLLYSSCLQAYAKSSSAEGARLAEDLLDRTKMLYREGKLYAKPNVLFYNAVSCECDFLFTLV